MSVIEWQDKYSLGIEPFDAHHRHLVGLLNSLFDAFVTRSQAEKLGDLLPELVDYAAYHFDAEEQWMKEREYLKFDEHRKMHAHFTRRVGDLQTAPASGEDKSLETLILLSDWLTNHILIADADFCRFTVRNK